MREIKITEILPKWFTWEILIEHSWVKFWTIIIEEPLGEETDFSFFMFDIIKDILVWMNNKEISKKVLIDKTLNKYLYENSEISKVFWEDFKFTML